MSLQILVQPSFTPREREVLARLCLGETYRAIARSLGISTHTVDTHIRRVRSKAGVTNRSQLVSLSVELGLFQPKPMGLRAAGDEVSPQTS
ncbi:MULTISPECIES: helix-turn-helix transcriptional regulator [unclassified Streptomyces]|uniref:response regulator transcription factor n=1 Tax=unclassified Streptomyces TaxID=2593676 RepID=UPI0033B0DA7B